jgi:hypothetical protein
MESRRSRLSISPLSRQSGHCEGGGTTTEATFSHPVIYNFVYGGCTKIIIKPRPKPAYRTRQATFSHPVICNLSSLNHDRSLPAGSGWKTAELLFSVPWFLVNVLFYDFVCLPGRNNFFWRSCFFTLFF